MIRVTLLFAFVCAATAKDVVFKDCGSKTGQLVSVSIDPCNENPCILHRGNSAKITINYISNNAVSQGTAVVRGVVAGIPVPFPLPDADLCKFNSPSCPLEAGKQYTYTSSLPILKEYPKLKVTVEWTLKDASGNVIVCMRTPVAISD